MELRTLFLGFSFVIMFEDDVMKPFSNFLQTGVLGPGFTGDGSDSCVSEHKRTR